MKKVFTLLLMLFVSVTPVSASTFTMDEAPISMRNNVTYYKTVWRSYNQKSQIPSSIIYSEYQYGIKYSGKLNKQKVNYNNGKYKVLYGGYLRKVS